MTNEPKPPMRLSLRWAGDLRFDGQVGDTALVLDSAGHAGPSPTQMLALGLAGCMGIDVVNILRRGRHPLEGLGVQLEGRRAEAQPPRFVAFTLHFVIEGAVPADAIERAIQLSRDKYCSVWHSLRQDIDLSVTYERSTGQ